MQVVAGCPVVRVAEILPGTLPGLIQVTTGTRAGKPVITWHRDPKQTLRVRPVFLHNDDRIQALIAVIGIALLIFGLIEAGLRAALGAGNLLPGILSVGRAAIPTARAVPAASDGLCIRPRG